MATAAGHPGMLAWAHFFAGEIRLNNDPAEAGALLEQSVAEAGGLPGGGCVPPGRGRLVGRTPSRPAPGDPTVALARVPGPHRALAPGRGLEPAVDHDDGH